MSVDNNRMLLELDKLRREINRETISPVIPALSLDELKPMITMVANARAQYIRELLDLAKLSPEAMPAPGQIERLRRHREAYDELVKAAHALETVIEREYLDIKPTRR